MRTLAAALLLASTALAGAQAPRNGPEWGGKDHQPTQAEVRPYVAAATGEIGLVLGG